MYIIENSSVEDIDFNLSNYINTYLEYGLLAFPSLNIDEINQLKIMKCFGDVLSWKHFSSVDIEDHSVSFNKIEKQFESDQVFIRWHLEHIERYNPQVCASWKMNTFTCDPLAGSTGFIDARIIYQRLPNEWKIFLDNVFVIDPENKDFERKCVQKHRNDKRNILKLSPYLYENIIVKVGDNKPSTSEFNLFREINEWFSYQVLCVEKDKIWWNWNKGDLLLVDLSTMIHSVKGGFLPGERIFSRYWGYEKEEDFIMYTDIKFNERFGLKNA
jgi:alpha-ketoglutarate-dependent taurine dioxygenase